MAYLFICLAAFMASGLTLFSGFGLGTLLTPVFAIFFPVQIAIAMTAVVRLANNLFKIGLVARHADWRTVARFGIPAAFAALLGAELLSLFAGLESLTNYELGGKLFVITPVKLVVGLLYPGVRAVGAFPALLQTGFAVFMDANRWVALGIFRWTFG